MTNGNNSIGEKISEESPLTIKFVSHEGELFPTFEELVGAGILSHENLKEQLKDGELVSSGRGIALKFPSLDKSRLLILAIAAAAREKEVFWYLVDQPIFSTQLLSSYRIDGNQLGAYEKQENGDILLRLILGYREDYGERLKKITSLVEDTIKSVMPHLDKDTRLTV